MIEFLTFIEWESIIITLKQYHILKQKILKIMNYNKSDSRKSFKILKIGFLSLSLSLSLSLKIKNLPSPSF